MTNAIPLMFKGRFGKMIFYIPPVISIMLVGSLMESLFILPAHLDLHVPNWFRNIITLGIFPLVEILKRKRKGTNPVNNRKNKKRQAETDNNAHFSNWFNAVEDAYGRALQKIIGHKIILFSFFSVLLVLSALIFINKMKFVMFPDEEATDITIMGEAKEVTKRYKTARLAAKLESVFAGYLNKEVVGFRTIIGESRHGRAVEENKFLTRVEVVSREMRRKSLTELKTEWQDKLQNIKELSNIRFIEHRFGQSSGSPIEILIQENDDAIRRQVVETLYKEMERHPALTNIEIDRPMSNTEYKIDLKRDMVSMLAIKPSEIAGTLRAVLQGTIIYELLQGDDETDVIVTAEDAAKKDINEVIQFPVENTGSYLIPIRQLVSVNQIQSPDSIEREDYKRTTRIFADLINRKNDGEKRFVIKEEVKSGPVKNRNADTIEKINNKEIEMSPLEVAEYFEANVFPMIISKYPSALISFKGEVKDTRESQGDLFFGIIAVLLLIYGILAVLFNSMIKPLIIMVSIPFGAVGIVFAFWLHGISYFGFFAAVGAIGLMGVVVNDSIVMISKLEKEYDVKKHKGSSDKQIADIAKTRLKAVLLTTLTTVAGLFPTAYGIAGYDSMLAEMMLAMGWGLIFATLITLFLVPSIYSIIKRFDHSSK